MTEREIVTDPENFLCQLNEELIDFIGSICYLEKPINIQEIKEWQRNLQKIKFPEERIGYEDYIENAWDKIVVAYKYLTETEVDRKNLEIFKNEADDHFSELTSLLDPEAMELKENYIPFKAVI